MISIIIPALNEEKFLPKLLETIKTQKCSDYEIIVADAGSEDKTVEIAKRFGAKVVKGGLPARGRNMGAAAAQGKLLLFLDADVILPESFLEKAVEEFEKRNLDVASCQLDPQTGKKAIKVLVERFYNYPIKKLEKMIPYGSMGIFIKRELYEKIKGFDEKITLGEDHDYVRRAAKIGKFGVLKDAKISFSLRRFEKDGWLKTVLKYIACELHYHFLGPIKSDIFRYKFGHYKEKIKR